MTHTPSVRNYATGCRCNACRAEHRNYKRVLTSKRHAERVEVGGRLIHPRSNHGTHNSYINWGCRCRECTTANTVWVAEQRRKAREP